MPATNHSDSVIRFFEHDAKRNLDAAMDNIKRVRERLVTMIAELDRYTKQINESESKLDKTDQIDNLACCLSGGAGMVRDAVRDASEQAFGARKTLEVLAALDRKTVAIR